MRAKQLVTSARGQRIWPGKAPQSQMLAVGMCWAFALARRAPPFFPVCPPCFCCLLIADRPPSSTPQHRA
eukprot:2002732-Alexandrium_andersonii.AAC.1